MLLKVFGFLPVLMVCGSTLFAQKTDTLHNAKGPGLESRLNDSTIYTEVDSPASFPGGRPAWNSFIQKNLNPAVGIENGARKGKYNVVITFTVTNDGTLKDFLPKTKFKHGFEEEVIRVLKLSPAWNPAIKNGVKVNSTFEQLQVFVITEG